MLSGFRVVLSHPLFPGNLGSVARACANFGVTDVVLVNAECSPTDIDALRYASGAPSKEVLASMKTAPSVAAAIADCQLAIAFARKENRPPRARDYSAAAWETLESALRGGSTGCKVALVFGKEDHGLPDEDIAVCSFECMIESADIHPTLNLSHAVAVVLHTLTREAPDWSRKQKQATTTRWVSSEAIEPEDAPARLEDIETTIAHWRRLLVDAGITTGNNPDQLLAPMAAVVRRAALTQRDVGYFRAFFSKLQNAISVKRSS